MKQKFRGKRIDNGEWVEGNLIDGPNFAFIATMMTRTSTINSIEVHPETVAQYTGLNDSEGNKLFSGQQIVVRDYEDRGDGSKDGVVAKVHFENGAYITHGLDYMCFIDEEYDWIVLNDIAINFICDSGVAIV